MNEIRSFWPASVKTPTGLTLLNSTSLVTADAQATTGQLPGTLSSNNYVQFQLANISTAWAYVNFGRFGSTTAATVVASYPVAPNSVVVVSVDPDVSQASVILGTAAATGVMIFTRGAGV